MPISAQEAQRRFRERHGAEEVKRRNTESARENRARNGNGTAYKDFVAVDGEGANIATAVPGVTRHEYLLLRAGDQALETGLPLTWEDCLGFLADLDPSKLYVGYFFDYDVTMMLRGLPPDRLKRLVNRAARSAAAGVSTQPFPVDVPTTENPQFQIEYLKGKEFKVRRSCPDHTANRHTMVDGKKRWDKKNNCKNCPKWVVINDVGSFFQCSFVKALTQWEVGTADVRADIARDKGRRSRFEFIDESIREYNALECELLVSLMSKFRAVCIGAGYVPSKWQGPGNLATTMLRRHSIPKARDVGPMQAERMWELANQAYYGGRFEISHTGDIEQPVYQYDINSAYPTVIRDLPCLSHGRFVQSEDSSILPTDDVLYIARGTFRKNEGPIAAFYGFPVRRKDGTIFFPANGQGVYWSHEIRSAYHQTFTATEVWRYERKCDCTPFGFIDDVYELRRRIGKQGKGLVLKLGLNSLYGKMAQSIGSPEFANPIWASLITSMVRAKLNEVIHDNPECLRERAGKPRLNRGPRANEYCGKDVLMLATDGVFTTGERTSLAVGTALGEWDYEYHPEGMFIVQPGLYFGSAMKDGKKVTPKTRGVPMAAVTELESEFRDVWNDIRSGAWRDKQGTLERGVSVPMASFVGLKLGTHRNAFDTMGVWQDKCPDPHGCPVEGNHIHKEVNFSWESKRQLAVTFFANGAIRTVPYDSTIFEPNYEYSKEIGKWRDDFRIDLVDTSPNDQLELFS